MRDISPTQVFALLMMWTNGVDGGGSVVPAITPAPCASQRPGRPPECPSGGEYTAAIFLLIFGLIGLTTTACCCYWKQCFCAQNAAGTAGNPRTNTDYTQIP